MLNLALLLLLPCSIAAQSLTTLLTNPTPIACPADTALVRSVGPPGNQKLSPGEAKYISDRTSKVLPGAWKAYLKNVKGASKKPLPKYVSDILTDSCNGTFPKVGIAVSGGGYRATLFGASVVNSLDGRNTTAAHKIGTGGLLQAASYITALSAGSWFVTSLAQANFPTVEDLIFPPENASASGGYGGFNTQIDLISPGGADKNATMAYLEILLSEVKAKHDVAGLPITATDLWSRSLSRHFVNGSSADDILQTGNHGAGVLFSDLPSLPSFMSHEQPFPIVVLDSFSPNPNKSEIVPGQVLPLTNEIWEANAYEMGSYDPMLGSFIPMKLLGSTNSSHCIAGFDQLPYFAGISSNIFELFNASNDAALLASLGGPMIGLVNTTFPNQGVRLDSAAVPNPFQGVNPSTYSNTNESIVTMIDGSSDGQSVPLQPLLVRARGIDTIIAIDAFQEDPDNFSNGSAIVVSAKRASLFGETYPFPSVPSTPEIFVAQNLSLRPTFFGCNDSSDTPLMIYIANGGPPANGEAPLTNTSTLQFTYTPEQVRVFLDQAFEISTQGAPVSANGTDPEWGACLACAVVDRARARIGAEREGVCAACMERYCWSGNDTVAHGASR